MIDIVALYGELESLSEAEQNQRLAKLKISHADQAKELEQMLRVDDQPLSSTVFLSQQLTASHSTSNSMTQQTFIGQEVMGFTIKSVLSESGGMGFVFHAEQRISSPNKSQTEIHKAAIKILRADKLNTQQQKEMFFNEASSLMALDHPNICSIYGISEVLGQPCIVMDYIDGWPLDVWLKNNKTNKKQKVNVFVQLLRAMSYLHHLQVYHGDLKPQNIIINEQGHLIVIDLGLARTYNQGKTVQTSNSVQAFSRNWSAPEQVAGFLHQAPSDVYSLGCILFFLFTGHAPEHGGQNKIKYKELHSVINKALATDPQLRYQSANELLMSIQFYQKGFPLAEHSTGLFYQFKKLLIRKPFKSLACVLMIYSVVSSVVILTS